MTDHELSRGVEASSLEMEQYLKEHISNNRSQIEDLKSTVDTFKSSIRELEDVKDSNEKIEEEVSKLGEEIKITSQTLSEKIGEIQERQEELEKELKDRHGKIDDITEKEIENRIEKKIEEKSVDELNKIQKLESRIDKLEDRVNLEDLEELDLEMAVGSKKQKNSSNSKNKSGKKKSDILTPAEISKSMKGETVKIKGELEYRKEASDNKFYRLSGGGSDVIVRSDHSIPEGRRILNGEVELIKGNICVYVDQ